MLILVFRIGNCSGKFTLGAVVILSVWLTAADCRLQKRSLTKDAEDLPKEKEKEKPVKSGKINSKYTKSFSDVSVSMDKFMSRMNKMWDAKKAEGDGIARAGAQAKAKGRSYSKQAHQSNNKAVMSALADVNNMQEESEKMMRDAEERQKNKKAKKAPPPAKPSKGRRVPEQNQRSLTRDDDLSTTPIPKPIQLATTLKPQLVTTPQPVIATSPKSQISTTPKPIKIVTTDTPTVATTPKNGQIPVVTTNAPVTTPKSYVVTFSPITTTTIRSTTPQVVPFEQIV